MRDLGLVRGRYYEFEGPLEDLSENYRDLYWTFSKLNDIVFGQLIHMLADKVTHKDSVQLILHELSK